MELQENPDIRFKYLATATNASNSVFVFVLFRHKADADKYNEAKDFHEQLAVLNRVIIENIDDAFSNATAERVKNAMNSPDKLLKDPASFLKDYRELQKQILRIKDFKFISEQPLLEGVTKVKFKTMGENFESSQKFKEFQKVESQFYDRLEKSPEHFVRILADPRYSDANVAALLNGVLLNTGAVSSVALDPKVPVSLERQAALVKSLTKAHFTYFADDLAQMARDEKTVKASPRPQPKWDGLGGIPPLRAGDPHGNSDDEQSAQTLVPGMKKPRIIPESADAQATRLSLAKRLHVFEYCAHFSASLPAAKDCLGQWSLPFTISLINSGLVSSIHDSSKMATLVATLGETARVRCQRVGKSECSDKGLKYPMPPELAELIFRAAEAALQDPGIDFKTAGFDSVFADSPSTLDDMQSMRADYRDTLK
jgi:hypothetical protein